MNKVTVLKSVTAVVGAGVAAYWAAGRAGARAAVHDGDRLRHRHGQSLHDGAA